jgi:hypothetical protein
MSALKLRPDCLVEIDIDQPTKQSKT